MYRHICTFRMHQKLHGFVAWSPEDGDGSREADEEMITLSLHIGIGCGGMTLMHLGGHQSRLEYVAAGTAISEAAYAEPYGSSGETIASEAAWSHLKAGSPWP